MTIKWVETTIEKYQNNDILCKYEIKGSFYGHFPLWFEKGWFLKQKLDHPREFGCPDCPECRIEV